MKVVYARSAREDIDSIRRWIARDDRARAIDFVRDLTDRAEDLASGPERFPLIDPIRYPGVRRRNHRGYRIVYRAVDAEVVILHIRHGARDTPAF